MEEEVLYASGTITMCKIKNETSNSQPLRTDCEIYEKATLLELKIKDILNETQTNNLSIAEVLFKFLKNGMLSLQDLLDMVGAYICAIMDNN